MTCKVAQLVSGRADVHVQILDSFHRPAPPTLVSALTPFTDAPSMGQGQKLHRNTVED